MARPAIHDREEALTRALRLFWAQGFHATSLKDIERALDMRPGSIYAAFGSKEGLYRAALDRYAADARAQLDAAVGAAPDPLAGLADFVRAMGGLRDCGLPSPACMLMKAVFELPEGEARDQAESLMNAMEAAFQQVFRDAQAQGVLDPGADPVLLAARTQLEIAGLRAYAQRGAAPASLQALAETLAAGIAGLRAPEPA